MKAPPLLPLEVLHRVLRVAQFNGLSLLVATGAFALASAALHDVSGTAFGLLVALAGAIELHGAALVRHGERRGSSWLVASQLYLMTAMLAFVAWRLQHIDIAAMKALVTDDLRQKIIQSGLTEVQFLRFAYVLSYGALGAATVLYQGGMAIYYARRRARVSIALHQIHDEA